MNHRFDHGDVELPDDLRSLDAELSSIQYEERASFSPELLAELEREFARARPAPPFRRRHLAVAAGVAMLLIGTSVPSARASLVQLMERLQDEPSPARSVAPAIRSPAVLAVPAELGAALVTMPPVETMGRTSIPMEPPVAPVPAEVVSWPSPTLPEILDRPAVERLIQANYPLRLQRDGVGGSVRLALLVDSTGAVEFTSLAQGSGVLDLDRAALQVAPSLRFVPATRRGRPIETWVEFDVLFRVDESKIDPFALPEMLAVDGSSVDSTFDLSVIPAWEGDVSYLPPVQREAGELLAEALGDDIDLDRLGSIDGILAGEPPAGVAPTQWRAAVSNALQDAMVRAPDNPAPLLALSRLRLKQGLPTEARILLERGLQRAMGFDSGLSLSLFAELHFRRGILIKGSWIAKKGLGNVPGSVFEISRCPQARSSGGAAEGFASVDRLTAWNYLCPAELGEIFASDFKWAENGADGDLTVMMASFRTAVAASPEHVGANVEVLLALADEGRWTEVLEGARRFVRASMGHPYGLLLGGMALQRLSRVEEANDQFTLALRGLPENEVDAIDDLRYLLDDDQRADYRRILGDERRAYEQHFWAPLDPILATEVNERAVEHTARSAYAMLRFGATEGDASEVWIRYGRPVNVRIVGERTGVRTEFWDYGRGPDITFSRLGSLTDMDLTVEGRDYVDDLREVFPHRYGTDTRTVFTLPAQVSRFHDPQTEGRELEIRTEVPALLATGESDTLDVGVFMLSQDGTRVAVTRRPVTAVPAPVTFRIPAAPSVRTAVVEIFNRATGQAAALREVIAPVSDGSRVSISDIMIAAASGAGGNVARDARWVEPFALVQPLEVEAIGVYFELYHLAENSEAYRVRAEVEDVESGQVSVVTIRPAGEKGFRAAWERMPAEGGVTREFFTVALSDIEPGRHRIRVLVDIPGSAEPLTSVRDIVRR